LFKDEKSLIELDEIASLPDAKLRNLKPSATAGRAKI
jgi:hypothetical protein